MTLSWQLFALALISFCGSKLVIVGVVATELRRKRGDALFSLGALFSVLDNFNRRFELKGPICMFSVSLVLLLVHLLVMPLVPFEFVFISFKLIFFYL